MESETELWAVNIQGPDDLVPVADYMTALRVANAFNSWWAGYKAKTGLHKYDPRMWAVPVTWDHSPKAHAEHLAKPSEDYAHWIEEAAKAVADIPADKEGG